jgi:DNA-binding response OmpR family regulator
MKLKILLAEDDKNLGLILKAFLDAKGHETTLCADGEEALNAFLGNPFDFCILDVMMPVKDGFTLSREIRKKDKIIPILFLTAKSLPEDKIKGFNAGADDYLTKPFSMDELMVRIRAIMRRAGTLKKAEPEHQLFNIGLYTFDFTRQVLILKDTEQKLTAKESNLLRILCENPNDVVDRSLILKSVWDDDSYFNARSMDVYMSKLRKYLQDDQGVQILNIHGVGFKLVVP